MEECTFQQFCDSFLKIEETIYADGKSTFDIYQYEPRPNGWFKRYILRKPWKLVRTNFTQNLHTKEEVKKRCKEYYGEYLRLMKKQYRTLRISEL